MTVSVLWLFLTVPWVGLQCVIVAFPDHTHLLFIRTYISDSLASNVAVPFKDYSQLESSLHLVANPKVDRGVTCLKCIERNFGNVVNAFMHNIPKREHLQIA